jgi:Asp-tRNA(Asn)/Glu-tRNA(Gln) amidotransferase A subunit family amidase
MPGGTDRSCGYHGDGMSEARLTRRSLLLAAAAGIAGSAVSPARTGPRLTELTAVEAVARMARGELRAEDYAAALLERCRAERTLNAFITFEADRVLEDARACDRARRSGARPGPLFGLPIPVKDSINTRDYPTTAGTPALRHFRPADDAPVVAALRAAGAIVLGKTNLHELSWGWTSTNLAYGAVRNPCDPARIPGGSSGGTAAAIAAHLAPLGVAEDTEGSIRVPAALCGIMGFRPTTGRYPTAGCAPISALFDQVGPHARSVADLALFDSVVANDWQPLDSPPLNGIRLGIVRDYWYEGLDAEVDRVTTATLRRLRDAGVVLVESELPGLAGLIDLVTYPVQNHDVRPSLTRYLHDYSAGVTFDELLRQASVDIRESFRTEVLPGGIHFVSDEAYATVVGTHLPALRELYRDYFARTGVEAIVFPATRIPATLIGTASVPLGGREVPFDEAISRNIAPGSTVGVPGLVLPAGLTSRGLPVAIELDGPAGADRRLLGLGATIARALGPLPPPQSIPPSALARPPPGSGR